MTTHFSLTLGEIAAIVGGEVKGDAKLLLTGVAPLESATSADVTYYARREYSAAARRTSAGAVITTKELAGELPSHVACVYHSSPEEAFVAFLEFIVSQTKPVGGIIHHTATIAPSSTLAKSVRVAAGVVIGERCRIDEDVEIGMNVTIEDDVTIGEETIIESGAIVRSGCTIGRRCRIGSGAVIGSEGFGYLERKDGSFRRIPHFGTVSIEDDVDIGANACIDRATLGVTVIRCGVKIDNLVHVAHNVVVGENTAIAAQVGIAGSTVIGRRNRIGGQVGIVGHIRTADDIVVGAQSGVSKSLMKKGQYSGTPAVELSQRLRTEALLRHLVELAPVLESLLSRFAPKTTDQLRDEQD